MKRSREWGGGVGGQRGFVGLKVKVPAISRAWGAVVTND